MPTGNSRRKAIHVTSPFSNREGKTLSSALPTPSPSGEGKPLSSALPTPSPSGEGEKAQNLQKIHKKDFWKLLIKNKYFGILARLDVR